MNLEQLIEHMVNHGSSMTIDWGEDNGCYEVAWITSGKRFCGVDRNLLKAMAQAILRASEHFQVQARL